eukprot:CAMPEP_0114323210 /NCGR_PEP_ID=MMETSP0059-20121206/27728_1 /TAXON_ID=36894 /ORGANISM="Pyramimonas parkeae, Strain CCMP726" /LENGTH=278 /DNA_ID=CAMNT_0001451419 /DNA_START=175 /DNA_END=1012 /DNA_ORIENTATION=-
MSTSTDKKVERKFLAKKKKEGAGFIVRRPIGGSELSDEDADPFLLLDELGPVNYAKGEFPGAPWHPHRGFDTVMYFKQGEGTHSDSMGNTGTLHAGDCQWMTAASGIIHDEGRNHPGGVMHGFQMWVNLPAKHKMNPLAPGVTAKIIAGECGGTPAVVQTLVPIQYIDFWVNEGASFTHTVSTEMETCFCYVYKGEGTFSKGQKGSEGDMLLMGSGDSLSFTGGKGGMEFLLLAGKKLREPIARHGPFVMNTKQEIMQAFQDYQNGTLVKHKADMREF